MCIRKQPKHEGKNQKDAMQKKKRLFVSRECIVVALQPHARVHLKTKRIVVRSHAQHTVLFKDRL